jgi:hypothetical protein
LVAFRSWRPFISLRKHQPGFWNRLKHRSLRALHFLSYLIVNTTKEIKH